MPLTLSWPCALIPLHPCTPFCPPALASSCPCALPPLCLQSFYPPALVLSYSCASYCCVLSPLCPLTLAPSHLPLQPPTLLLLHPLTLVHSHLEMFMSITSLILIFSVFGPLESCKSPLFSCRVNPHAPCPSSPHTPHAHG